MAQKEIILIPHVVINPTSIVTYKEIISDGSRCKSSAMYFDVNAPIGEERSFIHSSRKAEGFMSPQAKRKISKALEYLVTTSTDKRQLERITGKYVNFKCAFITLTLPSTQIHDDKVIINQCLNSFLNECRQYYQVRNYVWRAEKQKNGNIHFHLVIDKFIPWNEMRNRWNRIVNKLGYVDRFHEKHNHRTPNSTDIHSTRKIKNLKAYLVKYMSKQPEVDVEEQSTAESVKLQTGRIWGCNHELSQTRGLNLIIDNEVSEELTKILKDPKLRVYETAYFTVYYLDYHRLKTNGSDLLFKYFSDYLFQQLGFEEQLKFTA